MTHRTRRIATAFALTLAAGATAVPAAVAAQAPHDDLYVATAGGGRLVHTADGGYRLRLAQPARKITAFADHPARAAESRSLRRFVADWGALGFRADPPNAALVLDDAPAARDTYVFELSRPRLSGGALTFRARPVREAGGALERFDAQADAPRSRAFGRASLFVDDSAVQTPVGIGVSNLPFNGVAILEFDDALSLAPGQNFSPSVDMWSSGRVDLKDGDVLVTGGQPAGTNPVLIDTDIAVANDAGTPITGTATVPAGATLTLTVNGKNVNVPSGPFSIPTS